MHQLMEFVCNELEELERKVGKEGKLSLAEVQYADTLAHMKKNLLKSEEMWDGSEYDDGSSASPYRAYMRDGMNRNVSYARGRNAKRDSMGRYSRNRGYSMDGGEMAEELRELMREAPDEKTRMEFERFIQRIENM